MDRNLIKQTIIKVAADKYKMDLSNVDELAPLSELRELNPKFDSMSAIEMIFDVEDELGIRGSSMSEQPTCLKDIIDDLYQATLEKK
jgi:acyl carrier protein